MPFASFLSGIWGKLAAGLAIVGGVLLAIFSLKKAGRDEERSQQAAVTAEKVKEANDVEARVDRAGDTELDGLRDKWTRKP